jgi:hypothetical protein
MSTKPEGKLWKKLKDFTPSITWIRIENTVSFGTPDLLGYNKNQTYFTIEMKVSKSKKLSISPFQISYCYTHPVKHFILAQAHDPRSIKLYEGTQIAMLVEQGLSLSPIREGWDVVRDYLYRL